MPQPISKSNGWSSLPLVLLERPDHAALIGAIAAEWTQVERMLVRLLAGAFGRGRRYSDSDTVYGAPNPIAQAAMEASETIRTKIRLLDLSLGKMVKSTSIEAAWNDARADLIARAKERNIVVHGVWLVNSSEPDLILDETTN